MPRHAVRLVLVLALAGSAGSVPAMEFELVNVFDLLDSEERGDFVRMDIPQWLAVQDAASSWKRAFSDQITVRIAIRQRRGDRTSAQTNPAFTTHALADVKAALIADAVFVAERSIYEQIPVPLPINGSPPTLAGLVTLPTANAKALGLSIGRDPEFTSRLVPEGFDALITINIPAEYDDFPETFDVTRADGISPGRFDYTGMIEHEIGHALGFLSMVDPAQIQRDANVDVSHNPRVMDIWRFVAPRADHGFSETRELLQGPAEFFNGGEAPFVEFSRGSTPFSSAEDDECPGGCQAGHWRANETDGDVPLLMAPSVLPGQLLRRRPEDTTPLDFVGYDTNLATIVGRIAPPFAARLPAALMRRFEFLRSDCNRCVEDGLAARVPGLPPSPDPRGIESSVEAANYHVLTQFHADVEGLRLRSLAGTARFEPRTRNERVLEYDLTDRQRSVAVTEAQKGRITLDVEALAFASMRTVPPRLMGLEMHSDRVNGPALVLRAQIAQDGVQFDRSLGPRGGFEIAFLVDSSADKERGDVDAIINARLLAAGPFDIESTLAGASWYVDGDPVFDKVRIIDPGAFGVAAPSAGGKDQDAPGSDDPR